jgi:hypothetical protein
MIQISTLLMLSCLLALPQSAWSQAQRQSTERQDGPVRSSKTDECITPRDHNQVFSQFPIRVSVAANSKPMVLCKTERTADARILRPGPSTTFFDIQFGTLSPFESHLKFVPAKSGDVVQVGQSMGWRAVTDIGSDRAQGSMTEVLLPPKKTFPYPYDWSLLEAKSTTGQWYYSGQGYTSRVHRTFQQASADQADYELIRTTWSYNHRFLRHDMGGLIENFWKVTPQDPAGDYSFELWWQGKLLAKHTFKVGL